MDNILSSNKVNELEISLGLREKTPIELFYENPGLTLANISKIVQTPEMAELAVSHDGIAIKYVYKKLITEDLCRIAVMQNGIALEHVPEEYRTRELCERAVENNGLAISYVPKEWITSSLALKAVCFPLKLGLDNYPISYIPDSLITEDMVFESVSSSPCSLKNIPRKFITKELLSLAVSRDGAALKYVPRNRMNKELVDSAINTQPFALSFVPEHKRTEEICKKAFEGTPLAIRWIPEKYITREMCLIVIKASSDEEDAKKILFSVFPNDLRNDKVILDAVIEKYSAERIIAWNDRLVQRIKEEEKIKEKNKPLSKDSINYLKSKIVIIPAFKVQAVECETPPPSSEALLVKNDDENLCIYDLAETDDSTIRTIYYVTDIHLENQLINHKKEQLKKQLKISNANLKDEDIDEFLEHIIKISINANMNEEINNFLDEKLPELTSSVDTNGVLLIGGDVSNSIELTTLFYQKLSRLWHGTIISILGNHELWDCHPLSISEEYSIRQIDDIVNDYRKQISLNTRRVFLQNALYIKYKNRQDRVIEEDQILNASDEDLIDICSKASFILLGGIGFSGLNQYYNADLGLYLTTVTTLEEDKKLTQCFCSLYDKLNRCAGDKQVIVLTHTPVCDWTSESYNPNWIYINGHTHQNSLIRKKDGTTVLSDNQIGYKPIKWTLKGFTVSGWYDPFNDWEDGIHKITPEMYMDFNRGRGIFSKGCNYPGQIYALKRKGLYMFLFKSSSTLYLLSGGHRKRLEYHDVNYYYENMELYNKKVSEALSPYHKALENLAEEIRCFGGWGTVHGCIVDISWFSHIYVNPYDGKITPYYAYDIDSRQIYEDLPSLLKERELELYKNFFTAYESGLTPLLSQYAVKKQKNITLPTVPKLVCGTEMYDPSRIMRSVQYIFEQNVIRIWRDEILTANFNRSIPTAKIE